MKVLFFIPSKVGGQNKTPYQELSTAIYNAVANQTNKEVGESESQHRKSTEEKVRNYVAEHQIVKIKFG